MKKKKEDPSCSIAAKTEKERKGKRNERIIYINYARKKIYIKKYINMPYLNL